MIPFLRNRSIDKKADLVSALKDQPYLVDVRTPEEYAGGTVKGAVNIPLNEVPDKREAFKGKKRIIVFCQSGARSGQAKRFLQQNGVEAVLNGGNWQDLQALLDTLQ